MSGSLTTAPLFNPAAWYWSVTEVGPNFFWSSATFAYVPPTDPGYLAFIATGSSAVTIDLRTHLVQVMISQRLPSYLSAGIPIVSTGTPALNATYPITDVTLSQIGSVARDASSGLGFPLGISTYAYNDITGFPHTFTVTQFLNLYKAERDYITGVTNAITLLVLGNFVTFPTTPVTIA